MSSYSPADTTLEDGYEYDATSAMWKDVCKDLPCSPILHWPGYSTAFLDVTIAGQPAVIQCWKGLCEEFIPDFTLPAPFGAVSFPGGFGAEVGIYQRDTNFSADALPLIEEVDALVPATWPTPLRRAATAWLNARIARLEHETIGNYWLPADGLVKASGAPVIFSMLDPQFEQPLISGYHTDTYWTCKWMRSLNYLRWARAMKKGSGEVIPESIIPGMTRPEYYRLEFTVAGVDYVWSDPTGIHVAT